MRLTLLKALSTGSRIVFLITLLTIAGQAAVLLDTGYIPFAGTGVQFDRLSRNGESSTWGTVKSFPGTIGDPTPRAYELFSVNSGIYRFLQISLDDPFALLFVAAYLNSFDPVNSPPFFGLDVNYLGDPGLSEPLGNPSFFQIQVPQHSTVILPVNEIDPDSGAGAPFNLIVEGFGNAQFGEVPEPASFGLMAVGAILLAGSTRLRRRAALRVLKGGSPK
jgi:PEP-CTERM motif-containing protein